MTDVSAFCMNNPPTQNTSGNSSFPSLDSILIAVVQSLLEPAALVRPSGPDLPQFIPAHANAAFCRLAGFNEEDLRERCITALTGPNADMALMQPLLDAVRKSAAGQCDIPVQRKNSTVFPARLRLTPLPSVDPFPAYWLLTLHDCTHQRESSTDVSEILESTTDKVFILDGDWRFLYLNKKAIRNIARGRELLGHVFWEAFPETVNTAFEEHYRRAMREQVPVSFEAFYPPLETWYEVHAYPSPQKLTVYFRNINERKQIEQSILAQRSELAEIQRLARVTGWESNASRKWITFSGNASEVIAHGLPAEGCAINELIQRIHPEDRIDAYHLFTRPLDAGASPERTVRIPLSGDDMRFLLVRAQPATGSNVRGMLQDVTAQWRAELDRERSEHRLRLIFDSAFGGITITTLDGRFVDVNPAFAAMTEYTQEELRAMNFLDLAHPDDREHNAREVQRLINGGVSSLIFEKRNVSKSGKTIWMRLHVSIVANERTGASNLIGIIHDITQQKLAEEALQRSEAQLRQSQKMDAVGRLAGGIAHDFNNLLTVINGYSSLLLTELPESDPRREVVDHIARAGKKAAGLTEQLMAFGRKQVLRPTTLDINQIWSGMEPLLRRLLREDIQFTVVPASHPLQVKADQNQLEQVLLNLCVNARDAMPEGGDLTITAGTVQLGADDLPDSPGISPGQYIRLTVRDTGQGMDESTRLRAFEPFFTTRTETGASGLGLSTVYGIVQQSGGYVSIQSAPGHGTTVQIYLPRIQAKSASAAKRTIHSTHLHGTETILLAEDDPEIRSFLTTILRQYGYTVVSAANGAEALGLAQQHQSPIHLLLTDMIMPGMNGRALAQQIRQAHPATRVLYISGYTDNALDPETDFNQEVQYLKKPFTPRELMHAIRSLLDFAR